MLAQDWAACTAPVGETLSSATLPSVASTVAPTGIRSPATSGLPLTSMVPDTGRTSAETPLTGGGGVVPVEVVVVPVDVVVVDPPPPPEPAGDWPISSERS